MTLVSLMIGTVLSMLTILAMLALYKNLIQVAVEATQDASHDGGLASALLTAQMELAGAGFGLEENADTLVHLPSSAAVLWRHMDLDTLQTSCSGLLLREHPTKKEREYRTLTLLHKPVCNAALSTLSTAESDAALKLSWGDEPGNITNLAVFDPEIVLKFTKDNSVPCSNYSTSDGLNQQQITIEASTSSSINTSNSALVAALETIYTVCLANIPGSAGGENNEDS